MKDQLTKELARLTGMLSSLDPKSDDYSNILHNMDSIVFLRERLDSPLAVIPAYEVTPEQELVQKTEEMENPMPKVEPVKEEPKETDDAPSREDVRAALLRLRDSGVKVGAILKPFIPEGVTPAFSNVPVNKYAELMEAINNAG